MDIYIIYDCNEWQEYSSFRWICTVDDSMLDKALAEIKKERGYDDEEMEKYIYIMTTELNDLSNI